MPNLLDRYINRTHLHDVVLQALALLAGLAIFFSLLGWLAFSPIALTLSLATLLASCLFANRLFATIMNATGTDASALITALILFFILFPPTNGVELAVIAATGVIAMGSKYAFTINHRHLFNPAAFGAVAAGYLFGAGAGWWVATPLLLPFTALAGGLIVLKVQRLDQVLAFFVTAIPAILLLNDFSGASIPSALTTVILSWPLVFFATVMLTEPATTPPTHRLRLIYGALVGVLFALPFQFGPFYATPELALLLGNLFAYATNRQGRLRLTFKEKNHLTSDLYEFVFVPDRPFRFTAGQFLEWMVPAERGSHRGIRGYFTIASSPTEPVLRLGTRLVPTPGPFKRGLLALEPGDVISAGQLAGDFTLPSKKDEPIAFIVGGIGVTPVRSIIQSLLDLNETRDVTLLYLCRTEQDFAYKPLFDAAARVGVKATYHASGPLTAEQLKQKVPNLTACHVYISGPNAMVQAYKTSVRTLGVPAHRIKTDYFPGY